MNAPQKFRLPEHETRRYDPVGECIYCGSDDNLTDDHIIPFAAGGRGFYPSQAAKYVLQSQEHSKAK